MKRKKKAKQKKLKRIVLSTLLILFIGIGIYIFNFYHSFSSALDTIHQPLNAGSEKRENKVSIQKQDPFSVLFLGVDESENDNGRSDTMIVMTVNPQKESIEMLSIPRDTRTEIVGNGTTEKINHAYARGGVEMSINTVENFLDVPIDYYVKVNMDGFKGIIDALDGVTLHNDMDLSYREYEFPKGEIQLNGDEALIFSRIRYEDPRGDFGRQIRQRQIIQSIINKGKSVTSLLNHDDIFDALGENVKTNLTFKEMVDIQQQYKVTNLTIEQIQFEKGTGKYIGDLWYYIPDENELRDVQLLLKENLGLNVENEVGVLN
ncbi:LCP family protein [Bacillus sp. FJAT-29790]|nr:LCP family protein [Bacillus sp. FJAT-29790]MBU8878767.1 LCP family protein [Bacillus sp. FJAT-29790]